MTIPTPTVGGRTDGLYLSPDNDDGELACAFAMRRQNSRVLLFSSWAHFGLVTLYRNDDECAFQLVVVVFVDGLRVEALTQKPKQPATPPPQITIT